MRGAPPLVLFRLMAGHPRGSEKFRGGSLLDRGPLSLREREIVIDRTCALNACERCEVSELTTSVVGGQSD
jgi:hypothetical protein